MSEGQAGSANFSNFMTWRVQERQEAKPKARNFSDVVPMIPSDMIGGSEKSHRMNPLVKHAMANPFVPVGMVATVGCLLGRFCFTYFKLYLFFRNV